MGAHGRSVKVVGSKGNSNEWVIREGVKGKGGSYAQMGMTHFHATKCVLCLVLYCFPRFFLDCRSNFSSLPIFLCACDLQGKVQRASP